MVPNRNQCLLLFDKFELPSLKRVHVETVAKLALFLAKRLQLNQPNLVLNFMLIEAAALLHDIDKKISQREGEKHPDAAVRVLKDLGFTEVADVVRKHSLHAILDAALTPQTWEEKLVYLADKMTKYEVIGVDHRFKLWYQENLPPDARYILDASFPKVKALEKEIFAACGITPEVISANFPR